MSNTAAKSIPPLPRSKDGYSCPHCGHRLVDQCIAEDQFPTEWEELDEQCPECGGLLEIDWEEYTTYELMISARRTATDRRYMEQMGVTERDVERAHRK